MTSTNTQTRITTLRTEVPGEISLSPNVHRILLFLKDKINKFADLRTMLSEGGQYFHLIDTNRPIISFPENTDFGDLKGQLLKYKEILHYSLEIGYFEQLSDFIKSQDKEYRKKYMPVLNVILFGNRSSPSLPELIHVLGVEETVLRIDRAIALLGYQTGK